jgi:putative PIG3 family NAD(P)H quinone oxidoreductase
MNAIIMSEPGGPEVLRLGEVDDPAPQAGELLVRVRATALNRADLLQRRGQYNPPPGASPILGLELAGEVLALGAGVSGFEVGQRVMALVTGGSYAELAAFPAAMALPIPERFSFEEAAAIPEAFLTAVLNLFVLGELREGQRVLIHAGASGVGSAAIQLAREAGATVYATAGSAEKLAHCRKLGAALAINYKEQRFDELVREHSEGRGVNLVLDFVGAPYWDQNLAALGMHGKLVLIGMMGGSRGNLDIGPIMGKRLSITGTTLRATALDQKIALLERFKQFALPRLLDGRLVPTIDRRFGLAEAAEAHRYMESNANIGKIILTL